MILVSEGVLDGFKRLNFKDESRSMPLSLFSVGCLNKVALGDRINFYSLFNQNIKRNHFDLITDILISMKGDSKENFQEHVGKAKKELSDEDYTMFDNVFTATVFRSDKNSIELLPTMHSRLKLYNLFSQIVESPTQENMENMLNLFPKVDDFKAISSINVISLSSYVIDDDGNPMFYNDWFIFDNYVSNKNSQEAVVNKTICDEFGILFT